MVSPKRSDCFRLVIHERRGRSIGRGVVVCTVCVPQVTSPEGCRTGRAAVSAEAGCRLANAPLLCPVVGLGWTFHALSLGYFSLCEQRKVTRAPQAIGSLASDPSLRAHRRSVKSPWIPAFAGMTIKSKDKIKIGSSFRWNDDEVWDRGREESQSREAISASISSALRASASVSTSGSSRVTSTSSSVRMPMPRHFASTVVSSGEM